MATPLPPAVNLDDIPENERVEYLRALIRAKDALLRIAALLEAAHAALATAYDTALQNCVLNSSGANCKNALLEIGRLQGVIAGLQNHANAAWAAVCAAPATLDAANAGANQAESEANAAAIYWHNSTANPNHPAEADPAEDQTPTPGNADNTPKGGKLTR